REDVDQADIEKEREILKAQALNEPKPKPINIIEKMVEGRIAKYFKEVCLLEQPFVKDPDQSVAQMLGDVEIKSFVRFEMGEGLEKRQDNFAEEVMGQMKK
ncbi:MAG: translation elongation factor Ts, partial [Clostridia bacterium]|nr:translation elongation factor Ts [Clostridia bacterium]